MTEATPNVPISIEARLQAMREQMKNQISAPPSNKISTKGKQFTLPDGRTSQGPLEVIVVDFAWMLVHYRGTYNAAKPQDPDCWAIGRETPESGLLKPGIESPYAKDCASCPRNQWGTDQQGRGKACKNQRRLLVVPPDATAATQPLTLYVSPGAIKNWDGYLVELGATHGLMPIQVVTEISFDQNQAYPSLRFKLKEKHGNIELMMALREKAQAQLFRPIEARTAA